MKIKGKTRYLVVLSYVMLAAVCCNDRSLEINEAAVNPNGSQILHRTAYGQMSECDWENVDMAQTKTSIEWNTASGVMSHKVKWNLNDIIYSFSERGVYMSDVLEDGMITPTGYGAKFEFAYHEGDKWYIAYLKGPKLGDVQGKRSLDKIYILDGIPNNQNGTFKDYHICIATGVPETDSLRFKNIQSYVRFKVEGNEEPDADGVGSSKVAGEYVDYIEIHNVTSEYMAGDLDIIPENNRYALRVRSEADSMITLRPSGGHFESRTDYYAAIPVRSYKQGIRFDLYDAAGSRMGYVKTPNISLGYSYIFYMDDLLKYIVFLSQRVQLKYAGYYKTPSDTEHIIADSGNPSDPSTKVTGVTIEVVEGHEAKINSLVTPDAATSKSLSWESSDISVATVSSSGIVTGVSGGTVSAPKSCTITARTMDGSAISVSFKVNVFENSGLTLGGYDVDPFTDFNDAR